jgi:hypothetical protein
MIRYKGRVKEIMIIPGKLIPTGFKVWAAAQKGFLLLWNWHVLGEKNGPIGVRTLKELGGTIKAGNKGNKT